MSNTTNNRIAGLRELMSRESLGAFIVTNSGSHGNRLVADHWKSLEWLCGVGDNAALAVVTMTGAALWTGESDFNQTAEQLKDTEFAVMKSGATGTPSIAQWTGEQLETTTNNTLRAASTEVAIDGTVTTQAAIERLITDLRHEGGLTLRTNLDPMRTLWTGRPPLPAAQVELCPETFAGKPAHEKLQDIRQSLRNEHADGMLAASLSDISWTLNLRGSDVKGSDVFVAYLLIDTQKATLFIDRRKISPTVEEYLRRERVLVDDYERVGQGLKDYFEYNILIDPDEVNYAVCRKAVRPLVSSRSPIAALSQTVR